MRPIDDKALARVRAAFAQNFAEGLEVGAEVCIWQDGSEILHLFSGWRDAAATEPWDERTIVMVWSATKGPAAACVLHALQERGIGLETPVARIWPAFGAAGKEHVRLQDLLSHRAGMSFLARQDLSVFDLEGVAAALAAEPANWLPGAAHGYSPRTSGFWLDALVRHMAGESLGRYWRKYFADPLGIDFWIGLPESDHGRVARMQAPRVQDLKLPGAFENALANASSVTARAFAQPAGVAGASATNKPEVWSAENPSFGGIGSARALASFYGRLGSGEFLQGPWREALTTRYSNGPDLVLCAPTAFSAGFMMDPVDHKGDKLRENLGPSLDAFGHPGAGGSLAFADPENRLGFAYVMNRMENGVLREIRPHRLVHALYGVER